MTHNMKGKDRQHTIRIDKDNTKHQTQTQTNTDHTSVCTAPAMQTRNMKGRKDNTDDRMRQGQCK